MGRAAVGASRHLTRTLARRRAEREPYGSRPSGCRSFGRFGPKRESTRRSLRRRPMPNANGRARRRWSKSCAAGWRGWGRSPRPRSAAPLGIEPGKSRRRSPRSKPRALRCAGVSRPAPKPRNGASAGCSRAFTAIRWVACAPRSSRLPPATSCASCSAGNGSTPETRMEGPDALEVLVRQLEGFEAAAGAWETEILPARLDSTSRPGWMINALPDASPGPASGRATAASAARRRCGRPRSRCWRAAMRGCGRRCRRSKKRSARVPARRPSSTSFGNTARRSSTSWSKAPACCARRSRRRSASWWRSASSLRTALPGCAHCFRKPASAAGGGSAR